MRNLKASIAWNWGESAVEAVEEDLKQQGYFVFRLDRIDEGGAPMMRGPNGQKIVLTDLGAQKPGDAAFMKIEVKYKDHHDIYQKGKIRSPSTDGRLRQWQQGIDLPNWRYYCDIEQKFGNAHLALVVKKPGKEADPAPHQLRQSVRELAKHAQIKTGPHQAFRRGVAYFPLPAWRCYDIKYIAPPLPSLATNLNPWERKSKTGEAPAWQIEYCDRSPFERGYVDGRPPVLRDIADQICPLCGNFGSYGYGPPGWPAPTRWYCNNHRKDAERQHHQREWMP